MRARPTVHPDPTRTQPSAREIALFRALGELGTSLDLHDGDLGAQAIEVCRRLRDLEPGESGYTAALAAACGIADTADALDSEVGS